MRPILTAAELKQAIAELERKSKANEVTIKGQYAEAKQALQPKTVIRNSFSSLAETPEIRKTLMSTIIGFGLGYFARKATEVLSEESLNRMVGGFVDYGMNKLIEKNPEGIIARSIYLTRHVAKEQGLKLF